jgi:cyclophilin family peptidyl-prolyl cis-trans isomerase
MPFNKLSSFATSSLALLALSVVLAFPVTTMADTVVMKTPLGDIEIELLTEDAPNTVANFLQYVQSGAYEQSFVHRSIPGFVIQGGGFTFDGSNPVGIFSNNPIDNEFKVSNTRGTVAMAKIGGQPDSATSQWFINLKDNSDPLDNDNGGYTVFGKVVGDGMAVADAIAALPTIDAQGAFTDLPVINFQSGFLATENLVITNLTATDITPIEENFVMNAGLNDAWFNPLTDGQGFFITVFPDLGLVNLAWFTYDTTLPADEESANLGSPGHRWLTALGTYQGDTASLTIYVASGGLFDTSTDIQRTEDGTITLTFSDCSSGIVEYNIPSINQQGSVPIERVANDNVALCEALTSE